jgi:predicted aspartyl protease
LNTHKIQSFVGWIDSRLRPLINIRFWRNKNMCALLDTGFNGYLLWEASEIELSDFPGELSSLYESIEVAGGNILVMLARASIQLFEEEGVYTDVETFVALAYRRRGRGDPSVLLGTALLTGTTVHADFAAGTLRIQQAR